MEIPHVTKDRRLVATGIIAATSLGMMALSVPLCWLTGSMLLAYLTIGGSALSIAGVWAFGRPRNPGVAAKEVAKLQATIDGLRERLENVEAMNRFESVLAEKEKVAVQGGFEIERGRELEAPE